MSAPISISSILLAASALTESKPGQSNLASVLYSRLSGYYSAQNLPRIEAIAPNSSIEEIQFQTAKECLSVVERVQSILSVERPVVETDEVPLLGARDLSQLRVLLAIVFEWGTKPLVTRISAGFSKAQEHDPPNSQDYSDLCSFVIRVFSLLFPKGHQGRIAQTMITTTLLEKHVEAILSVSILVGWIPKNHAFKDIPPLDVARPLTLRLLQFLPGEQVFSALGTVMSGTPVPHVRKACAHLSSRQLLQADGIPALYAAVFGQNLSEDAPDLAKLEQTAKLLSSVPAGTSAPTYFSTIVPHLITLISDTDRKVYMQAAAFAIARMVTSGDVEHIRAATEILSLQLHSQFLHDDSQQRMQPSVLKTITRIITNVDPSPVLISLLISPIVPSLYSLLFHLDTVKTSDPALRESIQALLSTWARLLPVSETTPVLWSVIIGEKIRWAASLDGFFERTAHEEPSTHLFTPETLAQAEASGDFELDANFLGLYPDPQHFSNMLRQLSQPELASSIFLQLLEAYRQSRLQDEANQDPTKMLLFLQLIMKMQNDLTDSTKGGTDIFSRPDHILTFVKHALEDSQVSKISPRRASSPTSDSDSDDDTPGSETYTPDDNMVETAVTLLLSVLEATPSLSARTAPILNDIFVLLEPIAGAGAASLRPLAREARIVLTARLASTSTESQRATRDDASSIGTYQKALKLLQDPILPVRAHGLLLLRQLVSPQVGESILDPALLPAIQSIFLQSIQDDDSYIFLNAVQGLAAMADLSGLSVIRTLMQEYSQGSEGAGPFVKEYLDKRLRLGEALSMVIKRCGNTLGKYVNIIVPPLLHMFRSTYIPTVVRTSALSLLADCQSTHSRAILPFVQNLSEGVIDLLQVETTTQPSHNSSILDSEPSTTDSKTPSLRRSAIHFLTILIQDMLEVVDSQSFIPRATLQRAKTTLAYIATTDGDAVVQAMSRECCEQLDELAIAQ